MRREEFNEKMFQLVKTKSLIEQKHYDEYNVKRGLRNSNGTGVLVGITRVASVEGYEMRDGKKYPREGKLYYRGFPIETLVEGFQKERRFGFEEISYLLLTGELPSKEELGHFTEMLEEHRAFEMGFKEDMFFKTPSPSMMNKIQRVILALYSYEKHPDSLSMRHNFEAGLGLIAKMPLIVGYSYQSKRHYFDGDSLIIHTPKKHAGTAENILHLIRNDSSYTREEAEILDLCLVLHAEHGGGNNSAFANHVVSSSGTDIFSAMATSIGSLKGPKHGGANEMVVNMIADIIEHCENFKEKKLLKNYLLRILNKQAFDKKGLIYGMGHAVYTLSDPRTSILKKKAYELAKHKGFVEKYELIHNIEELTKEIFKEKSEREGKEYIISANVDMYSGFVYEMLGISCELYTPLFAIARMVGWCAHRMEQMSDEKIIRPAYVTFGDKRTYRPIGERR